jgi:hypothetical protein
MRLAAAVLALVMSVSCSGGGLSLFQQYEYEEDMYLALDGSATLYVSGSMPALAALRAAPFDTRPEIAIDRDAVRRYFTTPVTEVDRRPTTSRRNNRRFAHARVEVHDVRQLPSAAPFSWSSYSFERQGDRFVFKQEVGKSANAAVAGVTWDGNEVVAFRLHLPSKVVYHNAGEHNLRRGNILVWEQSLRDRLEGVPIEMEARMETQSILYRTLWLFGGTILVVAAGFVAVWISLTRRRNVQPQNIK